MNDISTETETKKDSEIKRLPIFTITILLILSSVLIISVFFPHFRMNLFRSAFEAYYFIPDQGSIFTFQPIKFNSGSEIFWLYGEDKHYFYYNDFDYLDGKENIIAFPKNKVASCPDFDPKNIFTWCRS